MDLIFSNNAFSSIEGNNRDLTIADNFQAGAYYNNAEGDWKSRTIRNAISSGDFNSAARLRNATRLQSRYLTNAFPIGPNPPVPPFSIIFLFPGMGDSTFRARGSGNTYTDQNLGAVTIDQIFIFDDPTLDFFGDPTVVDSEFEAQGVLPVIPNATGSFGELPWGWGDF
jgi:hypothetical protein